MKSLFTWITDVHISIKNLIVAIQVLREALEKARETKTPLLISGDLNDTKAIMRSEWVKALLDLFDEFKDVTIIILTGNHDLDNKNASSNSLEFLRNNSNVVLVADPKPLTINGVGWYLIPYQPTTDLFRAQLQEARRLGYKNIIGHQGVLGANMGDYIVDESSIDPKEFADFKIVLLGHYHKFQAVDNYMYGGSPFTVNHGESEQRKFIHLVNYYEAEDLFDVKHYETKARRHVKYIIESDDDLKKLEVINGSIAQIILKGPKEFVKKYNSPEKFKKLTGAESISIVPEISRQSEHRISAEILHSPLKVIDTYLASADTPLHKDRLKEFLFKSAQDLLTSFSSSTTKSFQVNRVVAKNFLSFKEMDFTYTPMGLTLVEGYDEDKGIATGAGKSSFFDATVYGLFGQTSKDIKADEVINRLYKKDCEVFIYLTAHDGEYLIKRYRKHKQFENDLVMILPNGTELRGKDNRETQKFIENELGCSHDLFLKSSYFTQFGAIDRFLSASDTDKKKLISEITDLSIYDQILDRIKKSITALNAELNDKEKTLLQVQSEHDITLKYLRQEEVNRDGWESSQQVKIKDLEDKKDFWEKQRQSAIAEYERLALQFESAKLARIDEAKEKSRQFETLRLARIEDHKSDAMRFEMARAESIRTIDEKSKIAWDKTIELKAEIDKLEASKNTSEQLAVDLADIKKKLELIEQLQARAMKIEFTDIALIDSQKKSLADKINIEAKKLEHNENGTCSHCHQAISPSLIQFVIDGYNREIALLDEHKIPMVAELNQVRQLIERKPHVIAAKEEIENKIHKAKAIDDVIKMKSQESVSQHNLVKFYADQKEQKLLEKSDSHYKIMLAEQEENPFSKEINGINAEVNQYYSKVEVEKNQSNPFTMSLETEKKSVNPFISKVAEKEQDIKVAFTKVQAAQFEVNCVGLDITYGEWWKQALHVYIKSYLMDSCLDQINDYTNEYLQTLFDGILQFNISATTEAGKDTKEKIDISIINNGDECSYQSLSGGERCRICLAVNLALSQIISKTNGKIFGMIFLDEIMNGLDEVGKTQSMKLLKELELQFPSVFIIDHAEEFKTLFTNSIMIKKKDKISYIV